MRSLRVFFGPRLLALYIAITGVCVNARYINRYFDLDTAAAEPRPIIIETAPVAEALPLVSSVDSNSGPLSDASEKIEKIVQPVLDFAYKNQDKEKIAEESKLVDQKTAGVDYYKYLESQDAKDGAGKKLPTGFQVEAGGEGAETKYEIEHDLDGPEHSHEKDSHKHSTKDEHVESEHKRGASGTGQGHGGVIHEHVHEESGHGHEHGGHGHSNDDDGHHNHEGGHGHSGVSQKHAEVKHGHDEDSHGHASSHPHGGGGHSKGDHGGHGGKFEKGGGKEHDSHHHGEHGEKGDKGYKGHHHHEKGQKGHHDKENHDKEYAEKGGHKKEHHHDDGYHGDYHKEVHGKKASKYDEKGEHNKGHSTKGSHGIHKKDEYEKKTEFFEEDYEGGHSEKHGGFNQEKDYKKGGHKKGGHDKGGSHDEHYGKKKSGAKGGHFEDEKGHSEKGGHDKHHKHESKHGKKESGSKGKKWGYKESEGTGGGHGGGGGGHKAGGHGNSHGGAGHGYDVKETHGSEKLAESAVIQNVAPSIKEDHTVEEAEQTGYELEDKDGESSQQVRKIVAKEVEAAKAFPQFQVVGLASQPIAAALQPTETKDNKNNKHPVATESKKLTKRRRLKKRKISKDHHADCLKSRKETHIPEESNHKFVIVAAEDS